MIRKILFLLLAAGLVVRVGYLCIEVSKGIAGNDANTPTVFYGRPLEIRKGDHPGNIRFMERLDKLGYKRITGKPSTAGTFSADQKRIRLFLRDKAIKESSDEVGRVEIELHAGRVMALISSTGKQLESIRLEPEEIGRMMGPQMQFQQPVPLADISPYLQKAVMASEDKRFYSHIGVDIFSVGRKFFTKEQGRDQSDFTITQQMVRHFFLSPDKTFARKLRETERVLALELRYSKKQILEMYLSRIYLGQTGTRGIYGFGEAARFYFAKQAKNLSLEEAALLAGLINEPNIYKLLRNPQKARERREKVLTRMKKLAMITESEYRRAADAPVRIRAVSAPDRLSYFIDYIQRITQDELGTQRLYKTGYRYYTTLDPFQQSAAEDAVTLGLAEIEGVAIPAGEPLQAALVAVDPRTGAMTAMVGGRSYEKTWFNRAVDARRQPGSAFKPFVLLAALAQSLAGGKNMTLSTLISGEPISLPTPEGLWTPTNFEDKKYGNITIRKVIEDSVNTATVRLANDVGFPEVLKTARLAGIHSPLFPVPSLALGSFEVTPMELAYAYTTIASGGIRFERFPLFSVSSANGDRVMERVIKRQQVLDPRVTYLAGYALEGVLERGTAKDAKALRINFPVSGKTGTTNGNRDSWFVSFTPDVVCAVWVGYDSGADTGLTGAQGALRISARFLRALYAQSGPLPRAVPQGMETAEIDLESGYPATASCPQTIKEAYLIGTAPKQRCPNHR